MAIKISGETVVDDSKKGLFNDVVVKGGAGESGEITLNCENNSHGVKLKGPAHSAGADYTLTLPDTSGSSGEVLTTDGSGAMSWEEVVGNEISATAPTSPSQGALWTDTSEDPAAPILKTWNGSAWVAVGSAAPSEFAPVINGVSLTENDTTGDRFTSQTFDVAIDMLIEGSPHSQKALKGEVTASFAEYPTTESITTNAVSKASNGDYGTQKSMNYYNGFSTPIWAPLSATSWGYVWPVWVNGGNLSDFRLMGSDSLSNWQYTGATTLKFINTSNNNPYHTQGKYFPPNANHSYGYLFYWDRTDTGNTRDAMRFRFDPATGWDDYNAVSWTIGVSQDPADGQYYFLTKENNPRIVRSLDLVTYAAQSNNNLYYVHGSDARGMIGVGNGYAVVFYTDNSNLYVRTARVPLNFTETTNIESGGIVGGQDTGRTPDAVGFAAGYFWVILQERNVYRSSDGLNWANLGPLPIPGGGACRQIEVDPETGNPLFFSVYSGFNYVSTTSNGGGSFQNLFTSGDNGQSNPGYGAIQGDKLVFGNSAALKYFDWNVQTLTIAGTGEDYALFNVGDAIRPVGSIDDLDIGIISSISGTSIGVTGGHVYSAGEQFEGINAVSSGVSSRYLVIEASGNVTGTVGSDPGYVNVGPDVNQTLTFPANFPTGNTPDEELAAGTTIKVSAQATNSEGSSEYGPSNIVTPN
jgi:hypothetical protein